MQKQFLIAFCLLGTSLNKTDDDNISIMAPHQSYFDEYPSGTGKNKTNIEIENFNLICDIIIYFVKCTR